MDLSTLNETSFPSEGRLPVSAYLYVVLDCMAPARGSTRHALASVEVVQLGRGDARAATRELVEGAPQLALHLEDLRMSRRHARLAQSGGHWLLEDLQSANGTFVNGARVASVQLRDGDLLTLGRTFLLFRAAQGAGPLDVSSGAGTHSLVPALEARFAQLGLAVRGGMSVMLQGEPGVGKELAARLVHALSGRKGDFVPVNCGGIPGELVAAQFFGSERAAFSGATEPKQGYIRAAHRGTLFLDEVAELPPGSQATLLRVLQEREVTPVGACRAIPVDLQLVTATNRDLPAMVQRGDFRADLLARLGGFSVTLPPLRQRLEDLGVLLAEVVSRHRRPQLTFSREAAAALFAYPWPGNIRELETAVKHAAAMAEGGHLEKRHLPPELVAPAGRPRVATPEREALRQTLVTLFEKHRGNAAAVSRELGKGRTQVLRWVAQFGIDPHRPR